MLSSAAASRRTPTATARAIRWRRIIHPTGHIAREFRSGPAARSVEKWSVCGAEWSQRVAMGGKWDDLEKRLRHTKTVAVSCHRLPQASHRNKDGLDGSSPSGALQKPRKSRAFSVEGTCKSSSMRWVWTRLRSFHIQKARLGRYAAAATAPDGYQGGEAALERFRAMPRTNQHGPPVERLVEIPHVGMMRDSFGPLPVA